MKRHNSTIYTLLVSLVSFIFLFNTASSALVSDHYNLVPENKVFRNVDDPTKVLSEESEALKEEVTRDIRLVQTFFSIADHFLKDNGTKSTLPEALLKDLDKTREYLASQFIDLSKTHEKDKIVYIYFSINEKQGIAKVSRINNEYLLQVEREEKGDMGRKESLLNQLLNLSPEDILKENAARNTSRLALEGKTSEAAELLFTTSAFQGLEGNLDVPAEVFNRLIDAYIKDKEAGAKIKAFALSIIKDVSELSGPDAASVKVAQALQIMAEQTLIILSWIDRGVNDAENIHLTASEDNMAKNDKRGKSFLDSSTLPEGAEEVKEEGALGFFWRGTEGVKKLGENILKSVRFSKERFDAAEEKLILYVMDHGFIEVPEALSSATKEKKVSTIHETSFVNDVLPGSLQTTSTGAGHFQGRSLDIKHATSGRGVQVNVLYAEDGKTIKEIIAQEVKEGDWFLALPGYVDYVINLGGLRFNDASVELPLEDAAMFNKEFANFNEEKFKEYKDSLQVKYAPYIGVNLQDGPLVVKAKEDAPNAKWIKNLGNNFLSWIEKHSLLESYRGENPGIDIYNLVSKLTITYASQTYEIIETPDFVQNLSDVKIKIEEGVKEASLDMGTSFDKREGILDFISENASFLGEVLASREAEDKLIRVPIELLDVTGLNEIGSFMTALQATPHAYVELFSMEDPREIPEDKYRYGFAKKPLPESLKKESRTKANTITIFPVVKGESLPASKVNLKWNLGGASLENTIVSPVGLNYDRSGLVRSIILGLKLSEIARNKDYTEESPFVISTFDEYKALCLSQGEKAEDFNLTKQDIINIARGDIKLVVESLNKLIKLLPIMPMNTEELRLIYENAKEALIRA